jgi:hypothetical protein
MYLHVSLLTRLELHAAALALLRQKAQRILFGTEILPVLYKKQRHDRNYANYVVFGRVW